MSRLALAIGLWLACAGTLRAQSPADLERAKASFKAGAVAYGAGDYPAAIQALESAYAITPLPAIAFSLAQANRRQYFATHQRTYLERALNLFRGYLSQQEAGRRADALDALAQLEPLAALYGPSPGEPAPAQPRRTRVMITTQPSGAQVSIDGAEPAASPLIRELPAGVHQVTVAAPGYAPLASQVMAVEGELILDEVSLRELPGEVTLSTPEGALVYVDDRFAGYGGRRVRLSLPHGTHRIEVAAAGRYTVERELQVERARASALTMSLPLTRQRRATRFLGVLGGASLATSVVLAGVSLAAQRDAEAFLRLRARQNVSAGALDAYRERAEERDRLRTASIVGASASAALLLATLLLHQLDRPRLDERTPRSNALSIRPFFTAHGVGVAWLH